MSTWGGLPLRAGERDRVRESLGIPDGAFVVGAVGRLTAVKGHRDLLDAAQTGDRPPWRGHLRPSRRRGAAGGICERQAAALGIDANVRFAGWQPDAARIMSAFDLFAFPSINEGMGKALVEAMVLEKPVVASRIGGIIDLVDDGVNGFLVPPADPEALADRILLSLENPETGRRMAKRAVETAAAYGSAAMVRQDREPLSATSFPAGERQQCPGMPSRRTLTPEGPFLSRPKYLAFFIPLRHESGKSFALTEQRQNPFSGCAGWVCKKHSILHLFAIIVIAAT